MEQSIKKALLEIFRLMYEKEGPRHWWPAQTKFEVVVGAILTQFVSWKNVTEAIRNLYSEGAMSIEGICRLSQPRLQELIRCTRFYKQKARKLKEFCLYVRDRYRGDLLLFFDKDMYSLREELLSLYGIGEETADSIILYAAEKPIFVVDSYTRRVFTRLGYFHPQISYRDMQRFFMENLDEDIRLFNEYHAQIDGVGARYCTNRKPRCSQCPLDSICVKSFPGISDGKASAP